MPHSLLASKGCPLLMSAVNRSLFYKVFSLESSPWVRLASTAYLLLVIGSLHNLIPLAVFGDSLPKLLSKTYQDAFRFVLVNVLHFHHPQCDQKCVEWDLIRKKLNNFHNFVTTLQST